MSVVAGRVHVPASVDVWLDTVSEMPESSLPCNVSTVAYAVKAASLYREAYRRMLAVVDVLAASIHKSEITSQNVEVVHMEPDGVPPNLPDRF